MLEPLAGSAADLRVLMAYRYPGDETRGAIELFPISGLDELGPPTSVTPLHGHRVDVLVLVVAAICDVDENLLSVLPS